MAHSPAPTTFERLRVLAAIRTSGTIAGAARALDYTPSAVSQHLAALEREAGTPLAERSNRGVELTQAGRHLAARAGELLDTVRTTFDELPSTDATPLLRVAAFPTAISSLVLPIRNLLRPDVRLVIVHAESNDALRLLIDRDVDVALTDGGIDSTNAATSGLHRSLLRVEPIVLVSSTTRRVRSLADCADAPWVLGGATSRIGQEMRRRCRNAGFEPDVIADTEDHHVTFDVIRATDAVSVLPELAVASPPIDIRPVHRIDLGIDRHIELVTREHLARNSSVRRLLDALGALGAAG